MGLEQKIKMAPRTVFFVIGLGLLGVFYSGMYDDGTGLQNQLNTVNAELTKTQKSLKDTEEVIKNTQTFQAEFQSVSEQFQAAVEYLPETFITQELLKQISNEARAAGVTLVSIKPKTPSPGDFYEELQVDVELEGSFTLLTTFLSYISKQNRIINIKNIEMGMKTANEGVPKLSLRGVLVAYRYKKEEGANVTKQ